MTLEDYDDMYSPDLRPFFRMLWAVVAGLLLLLAAAVVYIIFAGEHTIKQHHGQY